MLSPSQSVRRGWAYRIAVTDSTSEALTIVDAIRKQERKRMREALLKAIGEDLVDRLDIERALDALEAG